MSASPGVRVLVLAGAVALPFGLAAPAALAAEGGDGGAEALLKVLLVIVLALLACVGAGATALLLRVILPGVAASADASLARLSTRRLFLGGILPLVGAALLARAVGWTGSSAVGGIYALVVALPLALAVIAGAMAALPHLGGQVMRAGSEASPLARAAVGGFVVGLAMTSWALPALGVLVSVLLAGWLLGIGLGSALQRPVAGASGPPEATTE